MSSPSISTYLERNYSEIFARAFEGELQKHRDWFYSASYLTRVCSCEFFGFEILHAWVGDLPGDSIRLFLETRVGYYLEGFYGSAEEQTDTINLEYLVCCSLNLTKPKCGLIIESIRDNNERIEPTNPLSKSLIPYIKKADLDNLACRFLSKHAPAFFREETSKIDLYEVAKKMGVRIIDTYSLSSDSSIVGECVFFQNQVEVFDDQTGKKRVVQIPANSILIDKYAFFMYNEGSLRFTIAHELVHFVLHRKKVMLEKLCSNKNVTGLICRNVIREDDRDLRFIEWQANSLAARLLAPKELVTKRVNQLLIEYQAVGNDTFIADNIENIIEEIADSFGLSKQAAKIRMIECGFDCALEAFVYVDNHYVRPVGYKKGSLRNNETFSIGVTDLILLRMKNPELDKAFQEGKLAYVDSHVCVNQSECLEKDIKGRNHLSEYARRCADECLIKFEIRITDKRYSKSSYGTLFREFSGIDVAFVYSEEVNKTPWGLYQAILGRDNDIKELFGLINGDFGDSLRALLSHLKISVESFADEIGVSTQALKNYWNGKGAIPKRPIAYAICIALRLPVPVCDALLKCAGLCLPNGPEGRIVSFFIEAMQGDISLCNSVLNSGGYDLIGGKGLDD